MGAQELVLAWVEDEIAARRLSVGDKLPGERALAQQLGVSRTSVREALRVMDALGVVRSRTGSGPTAGTEVIANPAQALGTALRLHIATDSFSAEEVVEARELLESWSISHVDASSDAFADAMRLLERMNDPAMSGVEFLELDAQFHLALARAAGNRLVAEMLSSLRGGILRYTSTLVTSWSNAEDALLDKLRREHAEIARAAETGDPAGPELVREHIRTNFALT